MGHPGSFADFKGLGVSGDKRIYGPDRCTSISNLMIINGILIPRNGYHYLATQRESLTNAIGVNYFQPSTSLAAIVMSIINTSSGKMGIAMYRDRKIAGRA